MSKLTGEKVIYQAKNDTEKSFEYTLPEYLPGVARIVKATVCPQECVFTNSEGKATIHMPLKISVIYISEYDGRIKSFSFKEELSLPLGEDFNYEDEFTAVPTCRVSGVQCLPLSQRKIAVKAYLSASVLVYAAQETPMYIPDENSCVFTKSITLPVCRKKIIPDSYFENEAEINFADGKTIGEIINTDITSASIYAKPGDGQIDFEAKAHIHILYETPDSDDDENDSTYAFLDADVTLSDTIHCDKATPQDKVFTCIDIHSAEPSLSYDGYGENKSLSLTVKYLVSGFLFECGEDDFVTDIFAENCFAEAEYSDIAVDSIVLPVSKKEHITQLVHTPLGEISKVAECKTKIQHVTIEETEGTITASARCRMEILGTNSSGELYSVDTPVILRIPVAEKSGISSGVLPEILLGISDCSAAVKDGGIEARFEVSANGVLVGRTTVSVVSALDTGSSTTAAKKSGEITIYYPNPEEKLWDIAKKYRVSPEELCRINTVEEKDFSKKHTVIIP